MNKSNSSELTTWNEIDGDGKIEVSTKVDGKDKDEFSITYTLPSYKNVNAEKYWEVSHRRKLHKFLIIKDVLNIIINYYYYYIKKLETKEISLQKQILGDFYKILYILLLFKDAPNIKDESVSESILQNILNIEMRNIIYYVIEKKSKS